MLKVEMVEFVAFSPKILLSPLSAFDLHLRGLFRHFLVLQITGCHLLTPIRGNYEIGGHTGRTMSHPVPLLSSDSIPHTDAIHCFSYN